MVRRTTKLLVVGALVVGCSQQAGVAGETPPAIPTSAPESTITAPTATAEPTPTASPSTAATPTPTPTPQDQVLAIEWTVDFTITVPGDWTDTLPTYRPFKTTGTTFWRYAPNDRRFAMTTSGPDTVDEWITEVTEGERRTVTEPEPIEIGGAPGYVVDITPTGEGCVDRFGARACFNLFSDSSGYWPVQENRPSRAWIVDVHGETLLIVTDAPTGGFADWVEVVGEALATLEWD